MSQLRRYVILPAYGFRGPALARSALLRAAGQSVRLSARPGLGGAASLDNAATSIRVLDSIHEDGPKLVEMSPEAEFNLRSEVPGLKIVPVVTYKSMRAEQEVRRTPKVASAAQSVAMNVKIVDAATGAGLPGANLIAFTDFRNRIGDKGVSDASGVVSLPTISVGADLDRVYVYPPAGYWGHYSASQKAPSGATIRLAALDMSANNGLLGLFCAQLPANAGQGAKVAIVDTGVAKRHPALPNVTGGANVIFDETRDDPGAVDDWGPSRTHGEHGTHVAGIVGGAALAGAAFRGVAPAVEIRSYRVFPDDGGDAQNYDIAAAIARAITDGCDIINLSLGGGVEDEATRAGIGAALDAGVLVVAAAGNDYRKPVSFPAAVDACVAVSAYGRSGTFPDDSVEAPEVARPYGADPKDFVAGFSNMGPQIDVIGPGVGIVSTLPEDKYGVMSGTSMACPAIVGFAAYLLSTRPELKQAAGAERAKLLKSVLYGAGRPLGFGRDYEGSGLPRPS